MDFVTAVKTCFQKYIVFSGRAPRSEYWWFMLFSLIGGFITGFFDGMLFGYQPGQKMSGPINGLFSLALLLPSISLSVRRLHDLNKSGWWLLLPLVCLPIFLIVPVLAMLVILGIGVLFLVWYCTRGTAGDNRFGPDPLAPQMIG